MRKKNQIAITNMTQKGLIGNIMNPMSKTIGRHKMMNAHFKNVSIFAPLSGKIDDANILP